MTGSCHFANLAWPPPPLVKEMARCYSQFWVLRRGWVPPPRLSNNQDIDHFLFDLQRQGVVRRRFVNAVIGVDF